MLALGYATAGVCNGIKTQRDRRDGRRRAGWWPKRNWEWRPTVLPYEHGTQFLYVRDAAPHGQWFRVCVGLDPWRPHGTETPPCASEEDDTIIPGETRISVVWTFTLDW